MIEGQEWDTIRQEKIALKLLRVTPAAQEGFVLTDYPRNESEAALMEEYKGGMNAFVHVTLPDEILVDIEESKLTCHDCNRNYYKNDIISEEHGVRIEAFMPKDGHCDDCGSPNIGVGSDPATFEAELEIYKQQRDELLAFYNHYGLLVDFELRKGFEDYEKLKRSIQYNIKH